MSGGGPLAASVLAALATLLGARWLLGRAVGLLEIEVDREAGRTAPTRRALLRVVLLRMGGRALGRLPARHRRALAQRLVRAGEPSAFAPEEVVGLQLLAAAAAACAAALLAGAAAGGAMMLAWIGAAAGAGAAAPGAWLAEVARRRRRALTRALPGHLDLLVLGVEAGLDFAAALARVAETAPAGPLTEELAAVLARIRMGRTREAALRELAERTGHPDLARLVRALVRADRLGAPMGRVLRLEAARLRGERAHRAERRAAEAPVKLLLPLVLFIFPTVFLVIFGPIAFQFLYGGAGW